LIDLAQQRRELQWDLLASACGVVFCFSITYAFFMSVVLRWQTAAAFGAVALVSGVAFFSSWLQSARTAARADAVPTARDHASAIPLELDSVSITSAI
jgi:DMSO reductase anchor subunit